MKQATPANTSSVMQTTPETPVTPPVLPADMMGLLFSITPNEQAGTTAYALRVYHVVGTFKNLLTATAVVTGASALDSDVVTTAVNNMIADLVAQTTT